MFLYFFSSAFCTLVMGRRKWVFRDMYVIYHFNHVGKEEERRREREGEREKERERRREREGEREKERERRREREGEREKDRERETDSRQEDYHLDFKRYLKEKQKKRETG
jgi:hypothetical protein